MTRLMFAMEDVKRHWAPRGFKKDRARAPRVGSLGRMAVASDDDPPWWGIEYQDEVGAAASRIPPALGWIIRAMYTRAGVTQRATAATVGVNEKYMSRQHWWAVWWLANGKGTEARKGGEFS